MKEHLIHSLLPVLRLLFVLETRENDKYYLDWLTLCSGGPRTFSSIVEIRLCIFRPCLQIASFQVVPIERLLLSLVVHYL